MPEKYDITWSCAACGHENTRILSRHEAAFFDSLDIDLSCHRCGSKDQSKSGRSIPEIDAELLEEWFSDGHRFLIQDEELLIANSDVSEFVRFLAVETDLSSRRAAIGQSIAIKVYDNDFKSPEDREWCQNWLISFPEAWRPFSMDYVVRGVDEMLGIGAEKDG